MAFHTGKWWVMSYQYKLFFCVCFVLCCSPVSHPQQRPSGHYSSAGCHGETFPAWTRIAAECEGWSCSCGSEFQLELLHLFCSKAVLNAPCRIVSNFNFHPGQQKWNQIRSTDRGPNRRKVSRFLSCVVLWVSRKLRVHFIFVLAFSAEMQAQSPSAILKVSKVWSEVEPIWHLECPRKSIAVYNDFNTLFWLSPRGRSHRATAEAWGSQGQHGEAGITRRAGEVLR